MYNEGLVSAMLRERGVYPDEGVSAPGLNLRLEGGQLLLSGGAADLVELADLLVSLALSREAGDHWHIDELTLMDADSPVSELVLARV